MAISLNSLTQRDCEKPMIAQPLITDAVPQVAVSPIIEGATGSEILIDALISEGVDTIFGYPGGAVLHIYDELWRARNRITHYLVRHEQGAVHMAEGYARASGSTTKAGKSSFSVPNP